MVPTTTAANDGHRDSKNLLLRPNMLCKAYQREPRRHHGHSHRQPRQRPESRTLLDSKQLALPLQLNVDECCQGHIIVGSVMGRADSGMAKDMGPAGSAALVLR